MNISPSFEETAGRLVSQPDFLRKFIIGGLLCFIPVVNLFAFGYLYRYARSVRESGSCLLPDWDDPRSLFFEGLLFLVAALLYWILPLAVAWGLSELLCLLPAWLLGPILGYLVLAAMFLLGPLLFGAALYRLQMNGDLSDLLDVPLILRMTFAKLPHFILPGVAFAGLLGLGAPVYGFAFFGGMAVLLAYATLFYRSLEKRRFSGF